jgi:hypothetical protein
MTFGQVGEKIKAKTEFLMTFKHSSNQHHLIKD